VPGAAGDLMVTLGSFEPNVAGTVSVSAYVSYDPASGGAQIARSAVVLAMLDDQPPGLTLFFPPPADTVQGWIPRTPGTVEVDAHVDDLQGSGPGSATLTFDVCPAAAPC